MFFRSARRVVSISNAPFSLCLSCMHTRYRPLEVLEGYPEKGQGGARGGDGEGGQGGSDRNSPGKPKSPSESAASQDPSKLAVTSRWYIKFVQIHHCDKPRWQRKFVQIHRFKV